MFAQQIIISDPAPLFVPLTSLAGLKRYEVCTLQNLLPAMAEHVNQSKYSQLVPLLSSIAMLRKETIAKTTLQQKKKTRPQTQK